MANGEKVSTISIPLWALILSLFLGTVAGTWAVAAEAHNYRLQNITTRMGNHESAILDLRDADAEARVERAANRLGIERINDTLDEIKADVKTLLETR